jgi:penicillin-binding protein 1A
VAAAGGLLGLMVAAMAALTIAGPPDPLKQPSMVLVSTDGRTVARRGAYKDVPVKIESLPPYVGQAFVAIEDRRFYHHMGVDFAGIGRALLANARQGKVVQGGSTITQQLAKNAYLTQRRTFGRKLKEAFIALSLEARMSKRDILSAYVSSVYFGDGVYGLRAAAQHYFNKTPEKLTLGEAALLAGIVKAPSKLNPIEDPKAAASRAKLVLAEMVESGFITPAQAAKPGRVKVIRQVSRVPPGAYFADWVAADAEAVAPPSFGASVVKTTLDYDMQVAAETVVANALRGDRRLQAAMVVMTPDGAVRAMVGGRSYAGSQFNRATQAKRQPGSTFKLFVYLAALRSGLTPDDRIENSPLTIGTWQPANFHNAYSGPISLREAFARSSNVAAARLGQRVGPRAVAKAAEDLGITSKLRPDPSIALGASEVTLLEMASAYATVAGGRGPVKPYGITGEAPALRPAPITAVQRSQLLDMLQAVVQHGTGRGAIRTVPTFGKTGTSQDHRDALFIGFVDQLVVAVWVGRDDSSPMNGVTGGALPVQIWSGFMTKAGYPAGTPGAPYETAPSEYDFAPLDEEGVMPPPQDEFGDAPMFGDEPPPPPVRDSGYLEPPEPFPDELPPPPPRYRDRPRYEDEPPPEPQYREPRRPMPSYRDGPRYQGDDNFTPPPPRPRRQNPDEAPPQYDENAVG